MSTRRLPLPGHDANPWYREPWPWILMAIPAAAVVAGAVTIWLAVVSADGLVTDDYYRRGLAVNQEIRRDQAARDLGIAASVEASSGVLRVRLSWGQSHHSDESPGNSGERTGKVTLTPFPPPALFARVVHATRAGHDLSLRLARVAPGVYEAALPQLPPGKWRVVLEDPGSEWRIVKEGL